MATRSCGSSFLLLQGLGPYRRINGGLKRDSSFAPSADFAASAVVTADAYAEAETDRPTFWARQARELLTWSKDFTQTLDSSSPPFAKWFVGGEVNAADNALDRHVENGLGDRAAIYFEGEPGDCRSYTYAQLTEEVKKAANAFESLGVAKDDRVASESAWPLRNLQIGSLELRFVRPPSSRAQGARRRFG
jgi:hypothetical protein